MLDILKEEYEKKFTAREVAELIFERFPEECKSKQERSQATKVPLDNDKALIQQIVAEIGSQRPSLQKKFPSLKTTEERPRRYYFTDSSDDAEIEKAEGFPTNKSETSIREHDLYPLLSTYLYEELGVFSKRIDERRSSNSKGVKGNKWLYPDLVGVEDLSSDWSVEIKDCVKEYFDKKTKVWSFEVKILVNRSNVREVFFQAVSNSSWANYGYLVASEIQGEETMKELRILTGVHGIGLIQLDTKNTSESQILIPATQRSEVDWHTANRLTQENPDFSDYIKSLKQFYQTGEIREEDWDHISNPAQ